MAVSCMALSRDAVAQDRCPGRSLLAEFFTGSAWSMPLPLGIETRGVQRRFKARYSTRPLADAPYYSYRAGVSQQDGAAVELEMLHHKLYLENPTPPVEAFEVTHGYNLPMVNVTGPGQGWQARIGIGLVVAHPEGRIAGTVLQTARTFLGGGYHIAGASLQLAVGRRYPFGRGRTQFHAAPEARLTAAWARVRIDPVTLRIPNIAVHALGGVGLRHCA